MAERIGKNTILMKNRPIISGFASVVGKKEGEGPLSDEFDEIYDDPYMGLKSFEDAESELVKNAVLTAIKKAELKIEEIEFICAGDLLNQCIASSFGIYKSDIPFIGMYGACSTMALSMGTAALLVESGSANTAACATSSHFCSAERQYRFPLEYGGQRTPTAQWTVTGSGAAILTKNGNGPYINAVSFGKIVDMGVKDANNMGAAMAGAAFDTINGFLTDNGTTPESYDAIFTGDLGKVGSELLYDIADKNGVNLRGIHRDCGMMIFDAESQDVHSGGSGCGCGASVLCSYILKRLKTGEYKNILFCATGALLSPTSTMQGKSIPSIAHLINIVK